MSKILHRWTRLSSVKWEDAWEERLRFLGPERVAFITWPNSRALKVQAYTDARTAAQLVKNFGGSFAPVPPSSWSAGPSKPRQPLSVRGKLTIFSDEAAWKKHLADKPKSPALYIPAGMAFGTGDHATTANCLRFLADHLTELPADFSALDLGCGTGILAIAAEKFGAGSVEAVDFDPAAVRVTKENIRLNKARRVHAAKGDALQLEDVGRYDLVLANLFSELLISSSPRIARALRPQGTLIFSGVLRTQLAEVTSALKKAGFRPPTVTVRGKWCAGISQLTPSRSRR